MQNMNRFIKDYIENVDLERIKWIKLNSKELDSFFEENYLDKKNWEYILDDNASNLFPTILGMNYLNLDDPNNNKLSSFLIGIVDNNIDKKTVICATIYKEKYYIYNDQEVPVTYITTMEVNSYFRNKGVYKKMCEALIDFINPYQHIVTTKESQMGIKCNTFETLKRILISNGFKNRIFQDNNGLISSELHEVICFRQKVLKKY